MSDIHRMSSFYFEEFFVYLQIERLCDRLQLATRLEDRRDAVRGLKNLSKVKKIIVADEHGFFRYSKLNRNVNLKWEPRV